LFTGVLTEVPVAAGTGGPTLECILGEQFMRLKFGDRFWYQGSDVGLSGGKNRSSRCQGAWGMLHNFIIPHVQTQSNRVCNFHVILLGFFLNASEGSLFTSGL
jgi:hypothetical protein